MAHHYAFEGVLKRRTVQRKDGVHVRRIAQDGRGPSFLEFLVRDASRLLVAPECRQKLLVNHQRCAAQVHSFIVPVFPSLEILVVLPKKMVRLHCLPHILRALSSSWASAVSGRRPNRRLSTATAATQCNRTQSPARFSRKREYCRRRAEIFGTVR